MFLIDDPKTFKKDLKILGLIYLIVIIAITILLGYNPK
jgi:hypothetical protein